MSEGCRLCPRNCGTDRTRRVGVCGVTNTLRIGRAALHMWKEPCISGITGSGTVFFAGCPLRCVYCQNADLAGARKGKQEITPKQLAEIFLGLQEQKAANINLVTPTHYSLQIRQAVAMAKVQGLRLPIVYNCSGYEKAETLRLLEDTVDVYLTDFKYWKPETGARYSRAEDYPKTARTAVAEMVRQQPEPIFNEEGMMQKGVIVRHLLLPGHVKEAKAIVKYLYEAYGNKIFISLMNQYTPFSRVREKYPELARTVTKREYESLTDYALELGIQNGFIQEGKTAKESFIPEFQ